jgi:hypothetical protein
MNEDKRNVGWRLPVLLVLVLAAIIVSRGWILRETSSTHDPSASQDDAIRSRGQAVFLAIESGDGNSQQIDGLPFREGMTVRDLMVAAQNDNRSLRFTQRGSGATAMLIELGGVANQGGDGRNWMYWVNDELAKVSFDVYKLQPGDRVLWKFAQNE